MAVKRQNFWQQRKPNWATTCSRPLEPSLYERHTLYCTSWMGHKPYSRCVQFGSASNFDCTTALARSIEGACGMSPYFSALETPQSKLRTNIRSLYSQSGDRRRNTAQHLCNQSGHSGTQQNFCAANQKRENQTMVPRSPTFRRASRKGRSRLYRGVSA